MSDAEIPEDAEDSVYTSGNSAKDVAWQRFLGQLKSRGPAHSRYVFRGEIAQGGMGVIHRVYDLDVRRHLAMKVILCKGGKGGARKTGDTPDADSHSLGRFLEEAQVTGQLDHPGIVPIHELGVDENDEVYFTMKLVKGEDLRSVFDRVHDPTDDGWNQTRALSLLLRVCEAMAYAHSKKVIHRDLKPANIMVGKYGETYVMDWGLARVLGKQDQKDLRIRPLRTLQQSSTFVQSLRKDASDVSPDSPLITMDGDVVGTPAYMSPEQAAGKLLEIGPPTDIYAIGAMLYHLLTDHMPYLPPGIVLSQRAVWSCLQQGPPASLDQAAKEAPAELVAICDKAMSRKISDRYANMEELAVDLRAYLEHRVVAAYESGALAELKKWVKRNKALAATAAAALLAVLVLSGWALFEREAALAEKDRADENAALAGQRAQEATARKAEFDQLAGMVFLEDALAAEQDLYPAWPEKIAAMEEWLAEDAANLSLLKPTLVQTLSDLEERALPWTPEEKEHDRSSHARIAELTPLTLRVESLRRAQALQDVLEEVEVASLPAELLTADAKGLNDYAWPRVDPDLQKRIFGEEREALAAARAALAKIESGDESAQKPSLQDTLAWALFATGSDAQALAVSQDSREALEKAIAAREEILSGLESELAGLEVEISRRRTWRFGSESQRFLHSTLSKLSEEISSFEATEKQQVESRLSWARRIEELTLNHPNAVFTWEEARDDIQSADGVLASDLYREHPIDLKPQFGLVPIGMNPVTLLWEFYHLRSAWDPASDVDPADLPIPEHRDDGTIEMSDGTGIVFVLIPGGTFWMGAQNTDPEQPNFDPQARPNESPVHEVRLEAYYVARHELTVGQWFRLTGGGEPSWHERGLRYDDDPDRFGWTHPVNQVSWEDCLRKLAQHGLLLPTEAEWECAARGGTTSVWWPGSEASSLAGAANILDLRAEARQPGWGRQEGDFNDGYSEISPVGRFRANGFGLFDVHGNMWEWCRDGYERYTVGAREVDGLRGDTAGARNHILRGGSFRNPAGNARAAYRNRDTPSSRNFNLGLRPRRGLDP